jgi:excisionase family DNA binding protein
MTELLTIPEVAKRLHVHRRTVEREIAAKHIRVVRIGRRVLVTDRELESYIASLRGRRVA